jgi:two-component system, response regulator PdtaR
MFMKKRAIVIVEDDAIIQLCLKRMLQNHGYDVVGTASGGKEAMHVINETHPDAVLMDIHIKGDISGIEVYRRIESQSQSFAAILLSAYDPSDLQEGEIPEGCYFVKKPYVEADILILLNHVFGDDSGRQQRHQHEAHSDR